jgi:hypothetical protein
MHNKLPYRCDVLQIKDGELDQEFLMQEVLKELAEKSANAENQKLKDAIKMCAEKSKLQNLKLLYIYHMQIQHIFTTNLSLLLFRKPFNN